MPLSQNHFWWRHCGNHESVREAAINVQDWWSGQGCSNLGTDTVAIMSQCGRGQAMCRLGGVGKAAARCWVGVPEGAPNHVTRLSVVQDLAEFRLATCLFLSLVAHFTVFLEADQEEITGQCEWVQSMCRVGMADKATLRTVLGGSNDGSTERRAQNPHRSRPRSISTCAVLLSQPCGCCHCFS